MRVPGWTVVAWLVAAGLAAQDADFFEQADDYFRTETIEGVSKHAEAPAETPATVTIISREDIEAYGFRTVADVLNFASLGNFVTDDRRYLLAGSRGQYIYEDFNTRILVMLNGHALNEPWANFGGLGREMLVPMDLVERVEIVYGPSSLLYGGYSLYGIVNVVTRTGGSMPGARLRLTGGSWTTGEAVGSWGGSGVTNSEDWVNPGTEWSVLAAAGYYSTEGEDLDLPRFDVGYPVDFEGGTIWGGPQSGTDFERAPFAFLRARYGGFSFLGRVGGRKRGEPLAPYGAVYGSDRQHIQDVKAFGELRWDHDLGRGRSLVARVFSDRYGYDEQDPFADAESYPGEPGYDFQLEADDTDLGGEVRFHLQRGTHFLTVGGEYRAREIDQVSRTRFFSGEVAPGSEIRDSRSGRFAVLYLQEEWRPTDRLTLVAGGNWADTDPGGSRVQPRVAVIVKPVTGLSIKGLYGRGFRTPSLYEAAYRDFQFQVDNPDLESEEIDNAELSVIWSPEPRVSLLAYAFRSRLDGLIQGVPLFAPEDVQGGVGTRPDDPLTPEQIAAAGMLQYQQSPGQVRSSGFGVSGRFRGSRLRAYANVSYAGAEVAPPDRPEVDLPGSPDWLLSGGLTWLASDDLTAAVTARYLGAQLLEAERGGGSTDAFVEANLRLLYRTRLVYPLTLHLDVRNVFDETSGPATSASFAIPYAPLPGRQLLIGAEVRF